MKAHVWVMLKKTVLDPQGQTIQHALADLGYQKVQAVRQGKFFVLELNGLNRDEAQQQVEKITGRAHQSRHRRVPLRTPRLTDWLFVISSGRQLSISEPPGSRLEEAKSTIRLGPLSQFTNCYSGTFVTSAVFVPSAEAASAVDVAPCVVAP